MGICKAITQKMRNSISKTLRRKCDTIIATMANDYIHRKHKDVLNIDKEKIADSVRDDVCNEIRDLVEQVHENSSSITLKINAIKAKTETSFQEKFNFQEKNDRLNEKNQTIIRRIRKTIKTKKVRRVNPQPQRR